MLLERVANNLGLEQMGNVVKEKIRTEALLRGEEERRKENRQQEILERLDSIILAIHTRGTNQPGPKGPPPFPMPHPDPDFI